MAYDEQLADRIRAHVEHEKGLTEKRMFGGLAFLINGRMAVAAGSKGDVMLRVDPEGHRATVGASERFSGRDAGPGDGRLVEFDANLISSEDELAEWIQRGVSYAKSLPPK